MVFRTTKSFHPKSRTRINRKIERKELLEFSQTLQGTMWSSANESRSAAENNGVEHSNPPEVAISVLNTPAPPPPWHKITWSIRDGLFPRRKKSSSPLSHVISVLCGLFPVLSWGKKYDAKTFRSDLMAGLTLASLGIPQSIGYANLAKLDPQYGLYTSVVPPLIYAVMGSSREIAIGPVAVVSLILSSMLQKVADPQVDPVSYRKMVFTSTFFAGIFQAAFGLLRLGFLVDFLSHPAIVGFIAGAAIVISLQQLKGLLGITHFTSKTDIVSVMEAVLDVGLWQFLFLPSLPLEFDSELRFRALRFTYQALFMSPFLYSLCTSRLIPLLISKRKSMNASTVT